MEFLFLWGTSVITSFALNFVTELRLFKDLADEGYKADMEKLQNINYNSNSDASKLQRLAIFIPVVNLMLTMFNAVQCVKEKDMMIEQMRIMGVLEEMSEYEKNKYLEKPTSWNAFYIPLNYKLRVERAYSRTITIDDKECEVVYDYDKKGNLDILKSEGPMASLDVEEQKRLIIENEQKMVSALAQEFFNFLFNFKNELANDEKNQQELNCSDIEKDNAEIETNKQFLEQEKQVLQSIKDELLFNSENQNVEVKEKNFTKKLK